ncbi:PREDICTED: ATP-dependent DNA helicase Q5-like [Ceratosolen solmsi marchali]|uniref:ATP-dependent DNA helicase Q5-like n=1 Tax=Ceratosolen solmsi marchali TaxID=326594 RepID=A0AAJ6YDM9_9HYME|nr:PREDICTED: ATP-dependent DNA helicase Q5-like [Ceratosolen solmsi marchali]
MRHQKILQDKLQSQFGYNDYKNYLQKEATEAVYKNEKDIYICMPSGFGKSLCFQLPITIKDNSFAIVISPTIASATHQVNYLKSKQILVYNWDAYTSKKIKFKIKQEMKSRRPKIKLLYITPEQYISSSFQIILKNIQPNVLSYFVIDEVHCLSPWSHDYRHSYRKFVEWPLKRPNVPIIAVTASATKEVIEDIFKTLQMKDPLIFTMPVFRSNLFHDIWFIDNLPDPVQHLKQFIVESLGHVDMSVPKVSILI